MGENSKPKEDGSKTLMMPEDASRIQAATEKSADGGAKGGGGSNDDFPERAKDAAERNSKK